MTERVDDNPDVDPSRERWNRERAELRDKLNAAEMRCQGLADELARARSGQVETPFPADRLLDALQEGFGLVEAIPDRDSKTCDFKILSINAELGRIIGVAPQAARGRTIRQLFPDVEAPWMEIFCEAARTGNPVRFEKYSALFDRWFRVHAFRPAEGRLAVLFIDISRHKKSEAALRDANTRIGTILESITDGFLALDEQGRCTYSNETGARILGRPRQELIGKSVAELFPPAIASRINRACPVENGSDRSALFESYYPEPLNLWLEYHCHSSADGMSLYFRDIGARKEAEKARLESEAKIRSIFHAAPMGIGVLSGRVFLEANDRLCLITGYSRDELIGRSSRMLYPTEQDFELVAGLYEQIAERGTGTLETRFRHREGRIMDILLSAAPLDPADVSGPVTFAVTDITARKRAGEALRQTRDTLQAVLDAAPAGIVVADNTGRILLTSAVTQRILGGLITGDGHASAGGYRLSAPDGSPIPYNSLPLSQALTGETVAGTEILVTQPDGRQIIILASATPLRTESGAIWGAVTVFQDITLRKQAEHALQESEARFRQLADAMPQLVWTAGPDGRVDYYNVRFNEYRGIERAPDGGFHWAPVLHEEDLALTIKTWRQAVEKGEMYQIEHRVQRADGTYRWHLSRAVPIIDQKGRIVRWFGTATDINPVKQAEQDLRQLNETLEQRVAERTVLAEARSKQLQALAVELIEAEERERRRIARLLHDDLQQLLAGARLLLQSVGEELPALPELGEVQRLLEESIGKARRLSHELSPVVLYHSGLAAALGWLSRQMHKQFGLQVQLEADAAEPFERTPLKVFLFRAVQELLFNTVKHAGVKSARVILSESDGHLTVTVSDEGRGFDPAVLDSETLSAGFGLLSLRERARYIGGSLEIESAAGRGSRFRLKVPRTLTASPVEPSPAASDDPNCIRPVLDASGNTRVVFADDHRVMRQGLIRLITGQPDIEVVGEAANGREALELARQLRPDVVVMDVSMPEMDGIEATRRIKAELPEVRVIGLSMFEDELLARTMRMAGAETFMTKTVSSAELLKAIYDPGACAK